MGGKKGKKTSGCSSAQPPETRSVANCPLTGRLGKIAERESGLSMISGLSDSDEGHVRDDVAANSEQTAAVSDHRVKLLMREFNDVHRDLNSLQSQIWELPEDSGNADDLVNLLESCRLAGERGQVAYDAIQKRQDCSASTKVRAKWCLDSLQQRVVQIENSCVTLQSASSSSSNRPEDVAQARRMSPLNIDGYSSSHSRTDDLFHASTGRVATLPLRNYASSQANARSTGTLNVGADRVEAAPTRTLRDRFSPQRYGVNLHDRQNGNHPQSARFGMGECTCPKLWSQAIACLVFLCLPLNT